MNSHAAYTPQVPVGPELRAGYVVSMASGIHSFIFREIRELRRMGVSVSLFPTKVGHGPYNPPADWPVHRATLGRVLVAHSRELVTRSRGYLSVLSEAIRWGGFVDFVLAVFFAQKIRELGIQLVHCHFGDHKFFIGYFSGRLTGCPVSVTIHAYELYNNPNPALFRRALERAQGIVTVAEHNRTVLASVWGVLPERVAVIPLFTDLPSDSEPHTRKDGKIVILTVARFVEKKGHSTLLRALAKLPPEFEAWLVGSGPIDVRGLSQSLGVEQRVKLLIGLPDDELQAAYHSADIFCLPSETPGTGDREGIPVALMEAMAHALPVVTTRHAGIPELVDEVLVGERDPAALARALLLLGRDNRLRADQGRRNRQTVAARFSRRNAFLLKDFFMRLTQ